MTVAEGFGNWLRGAAGNLVERSEKLDAQGLVATFVDPGIEDRLGSKNNLVLYGRRGTGKTHVLVYLQQTFRTAARETGSRRVAVYLDLRAIGFGEDLHRTEEERRKNAPLVFGGFVTLFADALTAELELLSGGMSAEARSELDRLRATVGGYTLIPERFTQADKQVHGQVRKAGIDLDLVSPGAHVGRDGSDTVEATQGTEGELRPGSDFASLYGRLVALVGAAKLDRLVLILDEWSSVDSDVQPVLAEYLKRWCLPVPAITLTIGAIRGSTALEGATTEGRRYGLQHGSDFQTVLDLDDYFVPEDRPQETNDRFQQMLYRHLCFHAAMDEIESTRKVSSSGGLFPKLKSTLFPDQQDKDATLEAERELLNLFKGTMESDPDWGRAFMEKAGSRLLELKWGVTSARDLVMGTFASEGEPFSELVLASGGVFRDFLALVARASTHEKTAGEIDAAAARVAAREVFINGKQPNLGSNRKYFEWLMKTVIEARSRYFMIEPDGPHAQAVEQLAQLRAVHRVCRAVPDPRSPGANRDLYAIDFGAVVSQLQLARDLVLQPTRQLTSDLDVLEPFADGRRVPRLLVTGPIVLTRANPVNHGSG
jgi:hypothetical protein